jgi:hypothetical protein
MNRWEDWRVRRARSNYEVAAYDLLREQLPAAKDLPKAEWSPNKNLRETVLPQEDELRSAARVIPRIATVNLDEAAS